MFKELIRANDGSLYERAQTVILIDLEGVELEGDDLEEEIRNHYTTTWCNCAHDCCGHWRTSVNLVTFNAWQAVVVLLHTQNV